MRSSKSNTSSSKITLTHPDKIFWPKEGYTKKDLFEYYERIAPVILPYLKDRPESLNRHPNGIHGENFFQKDVAGKAPSWIKTVSIYSESNDKQIEYMMCNDKDTLLYMANLGCIEINIWHSRTKHLEYPDYTVFDFDPIGISFVAVVEAVLITKEILDQIKVKSFCKTSGATGLHVYVPLGAKYTYDQAKEFTEVINTIVNARLPKTTSIDRSLVRRQHKVYLDFLQNRYGQTMVAPYCVRPKEGAPVSTPLLWNEVNQKLDPKNFNIQTIHKRVNKIGDLWKDIFKDGIDMKLALDRIEGIYNKLAVKF